MSELTPEQKLELEKMKREMMRKVLTKEALERLGRVRMVNPALAENVEMYFLQLFQKGQVKQIDEAKLRQVLDAIAQQKKETRIMRR